MIVLENVPLIELEKQTINGHTYTQECCLQIIKDIIHKEIHGCVHCVDDDINDNICLTITNPYVNVIEHDDGSSSLILFCSVEIDETKCNDILEELKTNPFRLYPVGQGYSDDNGVITEYEILSANIEIKKSL